MYDLSYDMILFYHALKGCEKNKLKNTSLTAVCLCMCIYVSMYERNGENEQKWKYFLI